MQTRTINILIYCVTWLQRLSHAYGKKYCDPAEKEAEAEKHLQAVVTSPTRSIEETLKSRPQEMGFDDRTTFEENI